MGSRLIRDRTYYIYSLEKKYKRLPNEAGGKETTLPEDAGTETDSLPKKYKV
jgi:hypothetical protein